MSRPADPSTREHHRRPSAVAPIALTLAGYGGTPAAVSHALSAAAGASRAATRLSQQLMRSSCPQAIAEGGRRLTEEQTRECLRQAWNTPLHEVRRNGYDPSRVGRRRAQRHLGGQCP
jgi:hypothetical protein